MADTATPPTVYTIEQVAKLLGVHRKSVERWIHGGQLGYTRIGERGYRVRGDQLAAFIDAHTIEPGQ